MGRLGMFSKQEGRGSSGDAESDAPASWRTATQVGDRDGSVENNRGRVCFVWATMGSIHWHVRMFSFRGG